MVESEERNLEKALKEGRISQEEYSQELNQLYRDARDMLEEA